MIMSYMIIAGIIVVAELLLVGIGIASGEFCDNKVQCLSDSELDELLTKIENISIDEWDYYKLNCDGCFVDASYDL